VSRNYHNVVDFSQAPLVGTVLVSRGQTYVVVAVRPYLRRDGTPTHLVTWRSACADCGAHFAVTTGLRTMAEFNRRCSRHRAPGKKVRPTTKDVFA
jgi:hypothetical protein